MNELYQSYNCCAFCLTNYSTILHVVTKCKHKYHYNCFNNYIHKKIEKTLKICCPLCNTHLLDFQKIIDNSTNYEEKKQILQNGYTISIPDAINLDNSSVNSFSIFCEESCKLSCILFNWSLN